MLQKMSIEGSARNYFPRVPDLYMWRAPPMRPKGSFMGLRLNDLTDKVYGENFTESLAAQVWDEVSGSTCVTDLRQTFRDNFPRARLGVSGFGSPISVLSRALYILSISTPGATFILKPSEIGLNIDGRFLGMTNLGLWTSHGRVRKKGLRRADFATPLESRGNANLPGLVKTCTTYHWLSALLPIHSSDLEIIFAAAVTAGRYHEERLTEMFFVDPESEAPSTVWAIAREIVINAKTRPNRQLYSVLGKSLGGPLFRRLFGNSLRTEHSRYLPYIRAHHLELIADLEAGHAPQVRTYAKHGLKPVVETATPQAEAELLGAETPQLELQNLIGRL